MRTHRQLVLYQSILQVLQESGCPFCRFLKEYQTARLQNHPKESIHRLCNFHTWGLAAVQDAPAAAQVFIKLVDESDLLSKAECDICMEVLAEEDLRIRELVSCLSRTDVSQWLRSSAVLIKNYRQQIADELHHLRDEPERDRSGWGALGRAAEFLVSQRGLHS
jgi:hypothetical protein